MPQIFGNYPPGAPRATLNPSVRLGAPVQPESKIPVVGYQTIQTKHLMWNADPGANVGINTHLVNQQNQLLSGNVTQQNWLYNKRFSIHGLQMKLTAQSLPAWQVGYELYLVKNFNATNRLVTSLFIGTTADIYLTGNQGFGCYPGVIAHARGISALAATGNAAVVLEQTIQPMGVPLVEINPEDYLYLYFVVNNAASVGVWAATFTAELTFWLQLLS